MAISCVALGLLLAAPAPAQFIPTDIPPSKVKTNFYGREPVTPSANPSSNSLPSANNLPAEAPLPALPPLPAPSYPALPAAKSAVPAAVAPYVPPPTPGTPKPAVNAPTIPAPPVKAVGPASTAPTSSPQAAPVGKGVNGNAAQPGENVQPVQAQLPVGTTVKDLTFEKVYRISFDWPGKETLFKLQSQAGWEETLRQRARTYGNMGQVSFPPQPQLSKEQYAGRAYPPMHEIAEPNYVCYQRPYFEQKNFDRYGWDLGPVTPVVEAGKFFWDVAWLPYHMGTDPCRHFECNSGYCLPGDPVPLLLYPPQLSFSGLAAEAAVITGGFFVFP